MRNIRGVMDQVLDVIPDDFEDKDAIARQFDWILLDREFRPPELGLDQWKSFVMVLNTHFIHGQNNRVAMPWIRDILGLVNDKPVSHVNAE